MELMTCRHCAALVVHFAGWWWSDNDDYLCPGGDVQHAVDERHLERAERSADS